MERLSIDEQSYNEQVIRNLETAQGILEHWRSHLSRRYNLTERDHFTRDGMILRTGVDSAGTVGVEFVGASEPGPFSP